MDINFMLLTSQVINLVLLAAWIVLGVWALYRLRTERMSDVMQFLWVITILFIPLAGALAFLILRPKKSHS